MPQALTDLGPLRDRVTGLSWSYAKLGPMAPTTTSSASSSSSGTVAQAASSIPRGPSYASMLLLAQCSLLRKVKINLWYQDPGGSRHQRHQLDLADLAPLKHLEVLVVDKRPPFQQQLPSQQTVVKVPIDSNFLATAAASWPRLRRLGLGLAREDYVAEDLHLLVKLVKLQKLRLASYDLGDGDAAYMLPLPVTALPPGLQQLDLFHVVLQTPPTAAEGARGGFQHHPNPRQAGRTPGSSPNLLLTAATADYTRYTATGTAAAAARGVVAGTSVTSGTRQVTQALPRTMSAMPATNPNRSSMSAGAAQRAADTRARAAAYQSAERARVAAATGAANPLGAPAAIAEDSSSSALRSQRSFNVAALTAAAVRSAAQQYDAPALSMAASVNLATAGGGSTAAGGTSPFVAAAADAGAAAAAAVAAPQLSLPVAAGAAGGSTSRAPMVSPLAAAYLRASTSPGVTSQLGTAAAAPGGPAPLAPSSAGAGGAGPVPTTMAAAAAAPPRPSPFGAMALAAGTSVMGTAAGPSILAAHGGAAPLGGSTSSISGGGSNGAASKPNPFAAAAAAAAGGPASILRQGSVGGGMGGCNPLALTSTTLGGSSSSSILGGSARPSPFLSAFAAGGSATATATAAAAGLAPLPEAATSGSSSSGGGSGLMPGLSAGGVGSQARAPAPFAAAGGMAAAAAALGVGFSSSGAGGGEEVNPLAAMEALVAQSAAAAAAEDGQQQQDQEEAAPTTAAQDTSAAAGAGATPPLAPKLSFWGSVKKSLVPQGSVRRIMGLAPRDSHRPILTGDKGVDQNLVSAPSITKRLVSWGSISRSRPDQGASSSSSKAAVRASYDGAGAAAAGVAGGGRSRGRVTHDGSSVRAIITPRPTSAAAAANKKVTAWAPAAPLKTQTSAPMPKPGTHTSQHQQQSAGGGRLLSMGSLQLPGRPSSMGGTKAAARHQLSPAQGDNEEQEAGEGLLPCLQRLQLRHCELQAGATLSELVSRPRVSLTIISAACGP
jgi:hypothetical protein